MKNKFKLGTYVKSKDGKITGHIKGINHKDRYYYFYGCDLHDGYDSINKTYSFEEFEKIFMDFD